MDAEKAKGKKRVIANVSGELVLQWGNSKRLRAGKKEPSSASNAVVKIKQTNPSGKQTCRPRRQVPGDAKFHSSETHVRHCQNRKPIKSSISSALESKGTRKYKLSISPKFLAKSKGGEQFLKRLDNTSISAVKDKEMVVSRRGLEAGVHIGMFSDELQNLDVYLMPKFMIALSHKEKEEDFMAIKGSKLPIRPKRRAKHVQKALHIRSEREEEFEEENIGPEGYDESGQ